MTSIQELALGSPTFFEPISPKLSETSSTVEVHTSVGLSSVSKWKIVGDSSQNGNCIVKRYAASDHLSTSSCMEMALDELPLALWRGLSMAPMEHSGCCGGSGAKGSVFLAFLPQERSLEAVVELQ